MSGVEILLVEKWVEAIFGVKRVSDSIMLIKLFVRKGIVTVLFMLHRSVLMIAWKIRFMKIYNGHWPKLVLLRSYLFVGISIVTLERMLMNMREFMVIEDLEDIINLEGERILEFAVAHSLVVSNSLFAKEQCCYGCATSRKNNVSAPNSLLSQLKLKSLDLELRCNRLHCFTHVKQSELYTEQILDLEVEGNRNRGRPERCYLDAIKNIKSFK